MDKQFTLYISRMDPSIGGSAEIDLPAMPYAIQDALDKARIPAEEALLLSMENCRCDALEEAFDHRAQGHDAIKDIYGLNALAEKMAEMNAMEVEMFGGMINMDIHEAGQVLPVGRLYDLACGLDHCHFIDASNDAGVGRFYVENGFLPEMENVAEDVIAKLDFAKIGREMREAEGGVFLDEGLGYVVRDGDVPEQYKNLDLSPKEPGYSVLLEVGLPDQGEPEMVKLPLPPDKLDAVLDRFEARGWSDLTWRCADCKIPEIRDAISTADSIWQINSVAEILDELSSVELSTCKAMLSAIKFDDLTDVTYLLAARNDYFLTQEFSSPADVGMSRLKTILPADEVELLSPHVNLYAYGQSAMEKYNMELTDYGGLERLDGQPIQKQNDAPAQGGMEMI